jgi:hypothetical protein
VTALALMVGPTIDGWAVYLTNGREVIRYRGIWAKRRALRFMREAARKPAHVFTPDGR